MNFIISYLYPYNFYMQKKGEQQQKDRKLLQQLYSRLNITWEQRSDSMKKNPILHQTQNNLVSKSIMQKFQCSKKYKLNQWRPVQKKQSNHFFTTCGIISRHDRKISEPIDIQAFIKQESNKKHQNCSIKISPSQIKNNTLYTPMTKREEQTIESECVRNVSRSIRTASAHLSSRRPKSRIKQQNSYRRSSQNWGKMNKQQERYQVRGWDIEMDQIDLNCIDIIRSHTEH